MNPDLFLITGHQGSGKSTWCMKLAEQQKNKGLVVKGLLSPACIFHGFKIGIDLMDLGSGERRKLAIMRKSSAIGLITEDWKLDRSTLEWGNRVLKEIGSCDVFILDELGPLEFKHDEGLLEGFRVVEKEEYERAYVIIRPRLIALAKARWPRAQVSNVGNQ